MFRMIPAAVALAVTTTFAIPLSVQTQAQPQAPSQVPAPTSTASGQPAMPPTAATPSVPAPDVNVPATATQQQPPTTSVADTEYGTEILLLERIQKVLDDAADGQTGAVKMDRGMLDELRAEVAQVRLALKARSVRGS
jgi:hypothetical protein